MHKVRATALFARDEPPRPELSWFAGVMFGAVDASMIVE